MASKYKIVNITNIIHISKMFSNVFILREKHIFDSDHDRNMIFMRVREPNKSTNTTNTNMTA